MSKTEQSEKAPAVRVISVKTAKALRQKDGEPSLQYLLTRLHSLGFVATAAIPIRLQERDDDEFVVTSFLLVATQMLEPETGLSDLDAEQKSEKAAKKPAKAKPAKAKPAKKKPARKKPAKKPQGPENIGTKKHPPISE